METYKWTLRSGGAVGIDKAFEAGTKTKEIFKAGKAEAWAFDELKHCLPSYLKNVSTLASHIQNTLARNMMIILGKHGDLPVSFVLCYTETMTAGGTSYGVRCAKRHDIPVFNLYDADVLSLVETFLKVGENDFLSYQKVFKEML